MCVYVCARVCARVRVREKVMHPIITLFPLTSSVNIIYKQMEQRGIGCIVGELRLSALVYR
jgi:hypothetical protein